MTERLLDPVALLLRAGKKFAFVVVLVVWVTVTLDRFPRPPRKSFAGAL
jgi:hypothetical protein